MIPANPPLRVIVAQVGARHSYAVPRMLHARGALCRLYTDFCVGGPAGRAVASLAGSLDLPFAGKLRRRTIDGIPASKVYSHFMTNVGGALAFSSTLRERYNLLNDLMGRQMIRWGVGDANVVYGMFGSGAPFYAEARRRGLKIAIDVYGMPRYNRIVAREQEAFPDWQDPEVGSAADHALSETLMRQTIEAADLLLCPSPAVRDDLATFAEECGLLEPPPSVVAPYGTPARATGLTRSDAATVPGRIFFAGSARLPKGIHYLAMAANALAKSGRVYEFRVAGLASDRVRDHPAARNLTFLGHISQEQMRAEYAAADVFALPTLAEGSASVVYEAFAAGVPVVTTRSAGSVMTDGLEGFITPERDAGALAAAIERIVLDRTLRDGMSKAATATAANYSEGPWADRLIQALTQLALPQSASLEAMRV